MKNTRQSVVRHTSRGFTLIELLIAVIIIAILVSIIVAVYSNRAAEARMTAALSDLDSLQAAEQHSAIDTGYFYRFYALDDTRGGDNISPEQSNDVADGVRDEQLRSATGNPTNLFIDTENGTLLANGATTIYPRLIQSETNFNWNGPYVNYQRKIGTKIPPINNQVYGEPLDPWQNPYLFFTSVGVLDEKQGLIVTTLDVNGQNYNALVYDRPTVLSMGPNGVPGNGQGSPEPNFGQGDDIFRQF
jgi:prepilin-type N-terminal cleavage/methylation domain-containing protein